MTKRRKFGFLIKILFGILGVIVLLLTLLHLITPYIMGGENTAQGYFASQGLDYKEEHKIIGDIRLHSVRTDNSSASDLIVFLHGTPGSWMDFKSYLSDSLLRSEFQMIAIDRPGQGLSNYGDSVLSISKQADTILELLREIKVDSIILVGYSYGGPIAGLLASKRILPIKKLIMLSPANGPECEPVFWFNKILSYNFIARLFPAFIRVSNEEKMSHSKELGIIESSWSYIAVPTIHVHSIEDWIAPFDCNILFSKRSIDSAKLEIITLEEAAHFLPNSKLELVKSLIMK